MKEIGAHNFDIMVGGEESHFHRSGYDYGQGTDLTMVNLMTLS